MQKLNIHGKNWIGLFLEIQTFYNNTQKFFIPMQILIPDNFPFIAPMASVCLQGPYIIINPDNKDIDPKTCLINTNLIKKWDWSTSLNKIIEEISVSFNKTFPILQVQPGQNPNYNQTADWKSPQVSPSCSPINNPKIQNFNNLNNHNVHPNANINLNNSNIGININKIEINDNYVDDKFTSKKSHSCNNINLNWDRQSSTSSESTKSTNYSSTNYYTNENQNQNITNTCLNNNEQPPPSPKKIEFLSPFPQQNKQNQYNFNTNTQIQTQEEIKGSTKEILIQHIKEKIQGRFLEEVNFQKETYEFLETAKMHLDYKAQKLSFNLDKSDEIISTIQEELEKIKKEVNIMKNEVEERSSKFINKENCFDFVVKDIKFNTIVNLLCSQATIEDILIYIKKAFEKGVISFDETVKSIRIYSRELMKLKFIRDKILTK